MPEIIVKLGDRVVQKYLLYKDQKMTVGRAPDNDIALENPAVSRRHSTIQMVNGRYIIEDNNSANGTYVNGVRVTRTEILDKDVITIGKHKLHFYNETAAAAAPAAEERGGASASVGVLRITQGKQREHVYDLSKPETRIGRAADNDIRLQDWFVSKHHAVISRKSGVYAIRDLDSWRHTMVNGEPIQEAVLTAGDEIQFGPKITMRFEISAGGVAQSFMGEEPVEAESPDGFKETGGGEAAEPETAAQPLVEEPQTAADYNETGAMAASEPAEEPVSADGGVPAEEAVEPPAAEEPAPAAEEPARAVEEPAPEAEEPVAATNGSQAYAEAQAAEAPAAAEPPGEPGEASAEVAMWEKALANPSKVIRKQAARKLKQLTGRDYDID